jgi:hypothetical protein
MSAEIVNAGPVTQIARHLTEAHPGVKVGRGFNGLAENYAAHEAAHQGDKHKPGGTPTHDHAPQPLMGSAPRRAAK